ncbi:MAG: immune inhibitor A [Crocinitomicaceae bacterium]|nr:immune inhibitor A [Crocinitomicaceae bacterium]
MKKLYLALAAIFIFSLQNWAQLTWSRVKVYGSEQELQQLGDLGLPVDHGEYKKDTYFMTDLSSADIAKLDANGFTYDIVIKDVKAYYVQQNTTAVSGSENDRAVCPTSGGNNYNPVTPANFQLGTMGGFYKYQEFLDELDSMYSKYPNIISQRAPISTFTTIDGNPIYWLRISDNPTVDEAEEEVLYTALHHAREPASLSQLIYYMWYVLENYGTDPEITYLVDNTEMYFVPMINPDGYRHNELTDPNGGGMHRKNRNPISGGGNNLGVDLNRNYGYHFDSSGTSMDPANDTWPGTNEFSEIETQAMKWFVLQHDFKFAFNNHTHGNLLLYPIGWASNEFAPHHSYFDSFTAYMVKHNGYANMKSSGLYPASGDSDDWMYIDEIGMNGKDTIFALTPEVSSEGTWNDFWPSSNSIEGICKANIHMNLTLSHMPHVFGVATDLEADKIDASTGYFSYDLERLGLTAGAITVSMTPVAGIQTMGSGNTHNLNIMEVAEDSISYTLNSGIGFGDDIIYVIETNNGSWTRMDTIYKTYGSGTQVFFDDCSNTDNWTGSWSFTNEDFYSPSNCITDSPFVDYSNGTNSSMELNQPLSLTNATYAYVTFWAKWEIEDNWDYVQFMASTDGGTTWVPLCGNYTNMGGSNQDFDNPLYDGFQTSWVQESIDLADYLGNSDVLLKFRLISDGGVREDGFYFDDFAIYTDGVDDSGVDELTQNDIHIYPNPANTIINLSVDEEIQLSRIEITNNLGQLVTTVSPINNQVQLSTANLAEGLYFVTIYTDSNQSITKRVSIMR